MVFSSLIFLFLFLPVVLSVYFLLPKTGRNLWLLLSSLAFYAWGEGWYVLVMLATILFNYVLALRIELAPEGRGKRQYLTVAVAGNLLALLFYKYTNFLVDNLNPVLNWAGIPVIALAPVHLPIGISFFTFQAIAYVVDVAAGKVHAQGNLINYGMYKAFFPQLIAGPIVRYGDVANEVRERQENCPEMASGIGRFIVGLAKKVLIANVLAEPADHIFSLPANELSTGLAWLGILCYALQIYFDFSAYSDMAIGMARMFGFHFPENFRHPYAADSIRDFWRRWHISLSGWFRDYLYIPLGGSRGGALRTCANLMLVFAVCGIWHGASWTFLVWGLYHGLFLAAEHWWGDSLDRLWRPVRHAYVVLVVLVGWVFFRADTLDTAFLYLHAMSGIGAVQASPAAAEILNPEILFILALGIIGSTDKGVRLFTAIAGRCTEGPRAWAWQIGCFGALASLFLLSTMKLASSTYNPFIYFRF